MYHREREAKGKMKMERTRVTMERIEDYLQRQRATNTTQRKRDDTETRERGR